MLASLDCLFFIPYALSFTMHQHAEGGSGCLEIINQTVHEFSQALWSPLWKPFCFLLCRDVRPEQKERVCIHGNTSVIFSAQHINRCSIRQFPSLGKHRRYREAAATLGAGSTGEGSFTQTGRRRENQWHKVLERLYWWAGVTLRRAAMAICQRSNVVFVLEKCKCVSIPNHNALRSQFKIFMK